MGRILTLTAGALFMASCSAPGGEFCDTLGQALEVMRDEPVRAEDLRPLVQQLDVAGTEFHGEQERDADTAIRRIRGVADWAQVFEEDLGAEGARGVPVQGGIRGAEDYQEEWC